MDISLQSYFAFAMQPPPIHLVRSPGGCSNCAVSIGPVKLSLVAHFFTSHVFPYLIAAGGLAYAYRVVRKFIWAYRHRQDILNKSQEISEQLKQRFEIHYPLLGTAAIVVAVGSFIAWMFFTGAVQAIVPSITIDASTVAFTRLLFYISLVVEVGIWIVAIVMAFRVSRWWGWGTILSGAIPVVAITTMLAILPQDESFTDYISVLTLFLISTLVFSLYGPLWRANTGKLEGRPASA